MEAGEVIRELISQHEVIQSDIKQVDVAATDMQISFTLQRNEAEWAQTPLLKLDEKKRQLQETLGRVERGLTRHFAFEENRLVPLLGEVLGRGLRREHATIINHLTQLQQELAQSDLAGLAPAELSAEKTRLERLLRDTVGAIDQHLGREDALLRMMRNGLGKTGTPG